ncbi:MAG: head GIN domain-containing protein [Pseudomonadota bacterium]
MRNPVFVPAFLSLLLLAGFASAADHARTVAPFDAISIKGPINMVVQVGAAQAVQISGDEKFIKKVETRVVGGELVITFLQEDKGMELDDNEKILISVPTLRAFKVEGAGSATVNNINGERVDLGFQGAGKLVANGKVRQLRIKANGVGAIDTKALLAQDANVRFEGVGSVKVYASERLDLNVNGMGSLNYYGNPKKVHKSVSGIGSVRAGD